MATSERQDAEFALLASMYPHESRILPPLQADKPSQGATLALDLQPSYTLELSLPEQYPESAAPNAYLQCGGSVSTADRKVAREKLSEVVERAWQEQDGECLDVLVEEFGTWLNEFCTSSSMSTLNDATTENSSSGAQARATENDDATTSPSIPQKHPTDPPPRQSDNHSIKRTLLWSHHLLASSKRKAIITWSRELQLSGYSRPGYPGAIFVEGEIDSVEEFVRRMKALRWQALQVRAEETGRVRTCGDGGEGEGVVEVESLGEVVEGLRGWDGDGDGNGGVARMFLDGMKISH